MKKRVLAVAVLTIIVLSLYAMPAIASVRNYTAVGFRYIGEVFHEKEVSVPGGSTYFQVRGKGEIGGSQVVFDGVGAGGEHVYIQNHFFGTTALDATEDELVRLLSNIILREAEILTGVEMNPGESGYIRQFASSSMTGDGSHLKTTNIFGNTGGTTRRVKEYGAYMSDEMEVIGYAEVWEITELSTGTTKGGFWRAY